MPNGVVVFFFSKVSSSKPKQVQGLAYAACLGIKHICLSFTLPNSCPVDLIPLVVLLMLPEKDLLDRHCNADDVDPCNDSSCDIVKATYAGQNCCVHT